MIDERMANQFLNSVLLPVNPDGCFTTKYKGNYGYGITTVRVGRNIRKHIGVHRLSWLYFRGPIPNGLCVLHHCDNPACVRPDHLFTGTKADNSRDMVDKGRARGGGVLGSRNGNSKLRESIISIIRGLINQGISCRQIGKRYGVHGSQIENIKNDRTWRHVR